MQRLLFLTFLLIAAVLGQPAAAQTGSTGLPPRPTPFRFVNDEAQLMQPADSKKLEGGLRRYADNTGTQVVVVTVPSLGGRDVADYGQALGNAWGVGQRDKNNGVVVLISAKEHKVTIQPGSGLASTITPAVTSRVINEMTPSFKQGNYFNGLRAGLNTLMLTANPSSNPDKNQPSAATNAATDNSAAANGMSSNLNENTTSEPIQTPVSAPEPTSSGPGIGTLLIGALVIGGILWFIIKMFRGRSSSNSTTPDFLPNRPNGPAGGYNQGSSNFGGGYGQAPNSGGGMGMGGILATGAAAAAGAYLGNRMASGHETSGNGLTDNDTTGSNLGAGAAAGAGAGAFGTNAAGDYFNSRDGGTGNSAPDYFSNDDSANSSSSDYFSADDNSSYGDTSSDDTGGGGFDDDNGSSGSW